MTWKQYIKLNKGHMAGELTKGEDIVCDFETTTYKINPEDSSVYLWAAKQGSFKAYGLSIESYIAFCEWIPVRCKPRTIYFHNFRSWDGWFLFPALLAAGYKWEGDIKGFKFLMDARKKIYQVRLKTSSSKDLTFWCSANLAPFQVSQLAVQGGSLKGKIDYHKYKSFETISQLPAELTDYIWDDITPVEKFIQTYKQHYGEPKMTIGSGVKDAMKEYVAKQLKNKFAFNNLWTNKLTADEYRYFKVHGYFGGITEYRTDVKGKWLNQGGTMLDINSSYPASMTDYLPYGVPLDSIPHGAHRTYYQVKITYLKQRNPMMLPSIPVKPCDRIKEDDRKHWVSYNNKDKPLVYFVLKEEFDQWYYLYEMEYEIERILYFKATKVLEGFINELKEKKENAKDKVERTIHKLFLNNGYGKLAEDHEKDRYILTKHGLELEEYNDENIEVESISHIVCGLTITALSRIRLMDGVMKQEGRCVYADTDSMKIIGDFSKDLNIDDNAFGAWKNEGNWKEFCVIKAKCYAYINDKGKLSTTIAGLPGEAQLSIKKEDFRSGYIHQADHPIPKLAKKITPNGALLVPVRFTL